jgi:hypothetical protein
MITAVLLSLWVAVALFRALARCPCWVAGKSWCSKNYAKIRPFPPQSFAVLFHSAASRADGVSRSRPDNKLVDQLLRYKLAVSPNVPRERLKAEHVALIIESDLAENCAEPLRT